MDDPWTRVPIWLAMLCYGGSRVALLSQALTTSRARMQPNPSRQECVARWLLSAGFLFYAIHVLFAFALHHQWSHQLAAESTAQRTAQLTGWGASIGIYVNYLFSAFWLSEVISSWRMGSRFFNERPKWKAIFSESLFLFMIVNGAIVFAVAPARWIGVAVSIVSAIRLLNVGLSAKVF